MDPSQNLVVRFHFHGEFMNIGTNVQYLGGSNARSDIDRDKISLPEIKGHLGDHVAVKESWRYCCLFPGLDMNKDLRLLVDDGSCLAMSNHIANCKGVDIFVEETVAQVTEKSDDGDLLHDKPRVNTSSQRKKLKRPEPEVEFTPPSANDVPPNQQEESDSGDSDYQPNGENSEADESEAEEMRRYADQFRREYRAKKLGAPVAAEEPMLVPEVPEELGAEDNEPDEDSCDDWSYDEVSDGEGGMTYARRKSRWPKFDSTADISVFTLSMTFQSRNDFKSACKRYGLVTHRHIIFDKDEATKIRAKCSWPTCNWSVYASKSSRSFKFQVVTINDEHHCVPRRDNRLVTARVIADKYGDLMKANPTWHLSNIKQTVLKEFLVDVSLAKCKRARKTVMEEMLDKTRGEYSKVFDYQKELLRSNPGSTVAVKLDPDTSDDEHVFQRFYVCFDACKKGFTAGCRKVVGLDGCFFKGACQGELLCAIGKDANNQMYPIAWAVVEKECNSSWFWFLALLIKDLNINGQGKGWVFISDQQKGLINAISDLTPNAEHRMCARHIYANWKKKHSDNEWLRMFWRCAKAPCRTIFSFHRAKLAQKTVDGANDMMKTDPIHWSRAFFKLRSNCDSVENNTCESFNNAIISARYLPIVSMLEVIRYKVIVRIQDIRCKSEKWAGIICPNIFRKLKLNIKLSAQCHILWNGKDGYEVKESQLIRKMRFTVNLQKKTCSCRYWQMSSLPCCHALSAIYCTGHNIDDYIANCYSISEHKKTYEHCLQPVEGEESWGPSAHPRPKAPGYIRMPGRPKTKRRRESGEAKKGKKLNRKGTKMRCGLCGRTTHNMRTCSQNPNSQKNLQNMYAKDAERQRNLAAAASTSKASVEVPRSQSSKPGALSQSSKPISLSQRTEHDASSQNTHQSSEVQQVIPSHCVIRIAPRKEKNVAATIDEL